MLPSPNELKYLCEISETANLSRAAERLGITQPTLTVAVKRMEEAFGSKLLIRTKTGVELTRVGKRVVSQARFLINEWEKLKTDALRDEDEIRGKYIFGCHPSVALYSVPLFLPAILMEFPEVEFSLVHDLSRRITERVIRYEIDFAIVVNPWKHPDLVIRPLSNDQVTLWTSSTPSPLQQKNSDLLTLICDPDLVQSQSIMAKFSKSHLSFRRLIPSSSLEVIASLIANGAGVGILPSRVAKRLPELKLVPFDKTSPTFFDKIALIYRADAQRSSASRKVAQFIEKHFKEGSH